MNRTTLHEHNHGTAVAALKQTFLAIASLLLVFLAFGVVEAAPPAGTVTGVAKDALERPIGAAGLRLEASDGRVVARTTSDEQGRFTFTGVAPGTYAVVAEKSGFDTATAVVTVPTGEGAETSLTLASKKALDVQVAAKRLEEARINIQPRIGASTYTITPETIEAQPGGDNNPISQILLRAPGVSEDSTSQGGIHVRNEHANVQYRINGVAIPEGVSLFGQSGGLSPRLAKSIDLITGALPAQYGLRTAGVVDVQTKSGALQPGGSVGMYGGSQRWLQPSGEYGGSLGRLNYFVSGDYLQNGIGISPATPHGPIHDDTRQGHGFGFFEYILDPTSKLSAIVGSFVGHFQIPNARFVNPQNVVNGIGFFDSADLKETQLEQNQYAVLSYLKAEEKYTYQISLYSRYSSLEFNPDRLGDIIFNGIAQHLTRTSIANGTQLEGSYVVTPTHTLRAGASFSAERSSVQSTSFVLPADGGAPTTDVPTRVFDSTGEMGYTYSLYVQDAWKIHPTVTVNGGVRFDYFQGFTSEWQFSPRLNVVWTPTSATTVHAGYARYFTPPPLVFTSSSTLAKFVNTTAEVPLSPNDPVKVERANVVDVGVTQEVLKGLRVGLDGYYKQAENLLDDGQFGAPVLVTPFNYARGDNLGIELTTTFTAGNFSGYGNLAAAQQIATRVVSAQALFSSDDLAFIHDHYIHTDHNQQITASAGLSYLWNRTTRASIDLLSGSGLRRTVIHPNDATVRPWQQLNVGIAHRFTLPAIGKMQARFDVINLLDNNYELRNGTGVGVFAKQFGPPRGYFAGLKKEF